MRGYSDITKFHFLELFNEKRFSSKKENAETARYRPIYHIMTVASRSGAVE